MSEINIQERNPLGYEKISKLIKKFAIPSIVAMLVSSLYNIVDQIFIGQGVGFFIPSKDTCCNLVPENASFPIDFICEGIDINANPVDLNPFDSIVIAPPHDTILFNEIHPSNELVFIISTLFGIEISFNDSQL